jgi:hypothetical protein
VPYTCALAGRAGTLATRPLAKEPRGEVAERAGDRVVVPDFSGLAAGGLIGSWSPTSVVSPPAATPPPMSSSLGRPRNPAIEECLWRSRCRAPARKSPPMAG